MEERRRDLRTQMKAELVLKPLGKSDGENVPIELCDMSRGGIGFYCDRKLEIGSVYECELTILSKEKVEVSIEIVRREEGEKHIRYGGFFVAMRSAGDHQVQAAQ